MPDTMLLAIVTVVLNGAVTWGVVSTKLAWMRRDIDELRADLRALQHRQP